MNWFDIDDPNSLISYHIEVQPISSNSSSTSSSLDAQLDSYVLYKGSDSSQSVYLASVNGESVLMRVLIADEFGAAVIGGERYGNYC